MNDVQKIVSKAYEDIKKDGKRPTLRGLLFRSLTRMGVDSETRDKLVKEVGYSTKLGQSYVEAIINEIEKKKVRGML